MTKNKPVAGEMWKVASPIVLNKFIDGGSQSELSVGDQFIIVGIYQLITVDIYTATGKYWAWIDDIRMKCKKVA